jgi:hypothetical protein
MSETSDKLRAKLDELHDLLDSLDEVDPEAEALLSSAIADLRGKLAAQSTSERLESAESPSIVDRFRAAAEHFEESHPTLTGTIGSVIDALGRMGV